MYIKLKHSTNPLKGFDAESETAAYIETLWRYQLWGLVLIFLFQLKKKL